MKYPLFLLISSLFYLNSSFAQSIAKKEVDEFTGSKIIETSWEWLSYGGSSATVYFRIRGIDNTPYLQIKYMITNGMYGKPYGISQGNPFMLKLSNDSIVSLNATESVLACRGCGSVGLTASGVWGTQTNYVLSFRDIQLLKNFEVVKTRMYTNDGYINQTVNNKRKSYIQNALNLLYP